MLESLPTMKTVFVLAALMILVAVVKGAPQLEIQSAVEVKFGTTNNRIYQLEAASPESIDDWRPVGPAKWGRGMTVTNVVPMAFGAQLILRSKEYDLTNGLSYYFPMDGFWVIGEPRSASASNPTASRFGTPRHAALSVDYDATASAKIYGFAEGTNDFSISIWASSTDAQGIFGRVFSAPAPIFPNQFEMAMIGTNNGTIEVYFGGGLQPILVTPPMSWTSGHWYCFQLVRSANLFRAYRDGELVGEVFSEVPNTQNTFTQYQLTLGPDNGAVDEVRLYNRALSAEELGVLFRLEEH